MSSKKRNVQVRMVRIQWTGKDLPITHKNDVTVALLKDPETDSTYLRIAVNQKTIISEELNQFQWLEQSCSKEVVTISSSAMKLIILYDDNEKGLSAFFAEMKKHLQPETDDDEPEPSPPEDRINDLVKSIENGSQKEAERAAKSLAQARTKVQFNLINRDDDDDEKKTKTKKSEAGASSDVLKLQLHVECHLDRKPLVATIYVRSGTTLQELKEQIEKEARINSKDQYWYAFGKYLISDDYEFGSTDPVAPPRPANAPKKQASPPEDPIRSGDDLHMCIAQLPPFH